MFHAKVVSPANFVVYMTNCITVYIQSLAVTDGQGIINWEMIPGILRTSVISLVRGYFQTPEEDLKCLKE